MTTASATRQTRQATYFGTCAVGVPGVTEDFTAVVGFLVVCAVAVARVVLRCVFFVFEAEWVIVAAEVGVAACTCRQSIFF